jgi:hypothetical protein
MSVKAKLRLLRNAALMAAAGVALSACGGGSGSVASNPPPVVQPQEDFFGTGFAADFEASATSTPAVPKAGDIIPLSLTTNPQPVYFNN